MLTDVLNNGCMYDDVFRRLFTQPNKLERIASLIAAVLEMPVESMQDLVLLNDELAPEQHGGKSCRLDLLVGMRGRIVNVELQHGHSTGYFHRNLFTLSRILSTYVKRGERYQSIPIVNLINIIDFSFESIQSELRGMTGLDYSGGGKLKCLCDEATKTCAAYPFVNLLVLCLDVVHLPKHFVHILPASMS